MSLKKEYLEKNDYPWHSKVKGWSKKYCAKLLRSRLKQKLKKENDSQD